MENRKPAGYRELTEDELALINLIKEEGRRLNHMVEKIKCTVGDAHGAEPMRWIELARTDFQIGIMKLVRAVAQPTDGL